MKEEENMTEDVKSCDSFVHLKYWYSFQLIFPCLLSQAHNLSLSNGMAFAK
jgi:hypothetical protein